MRNNKRFYWILALLVVVAILFDYYTFRYIASLYEQHDEAGVVKETTLQERYKAEPEPNEKSTVEGVVIDRNDNDGAGPYTASPITANEDMPLANDPDHPAGAWGGSGR